MRFPPALRKVWQKLQYPYYALKGLWPRPEGVPPLNLMFDGPRSYRGFIENGKEFMRYCVELARLRPDETMLDVGSGIGRKTLPLVTFLNKDGSYVGMDIVKSGVDWCREHYKKYPNFEFRQIDVRNEHYNPNGTYAASEYKFPFPSDRFDFVVLNSVFTHMMAQEVENYVSEIARVLKNGGRCLISFFLLNDESLRMIDQHRSVFDLRYEFGPARAISKDMPEIAVGYDERFVVDLFNRHQLEIAPQIHYGSWSGRNDYLSFQDLLVAWKVSR
jgi:SAM-dependent methyltransferase